MQYRVTPNATTQILPSERLMGRRIKTKLDLLYLTGLQNLENARLAMMNRKKARINTKYELDHKVWTRTYLDSEKCTKSIVEGKIGHVMYNIRVGKKVWKTHVNQLNHFARRGIRMAIAESNSRSARNGRQGQNRGRNRSGSADGRYPLRGSTACRTGTATRGRRSTT